MPGPEYFQKGRKDRLPELETWPNQYRREYEIKIVIPEYTSICPKTGLPDFGTLTIRYVPDRLCVELKSLKLYILGFRNLGIFYENAVNRILDDLVRGVRPRWMAVKGSFRTRGGMRSVVEARHPPLAPEPTRGQALAGDRKRGQAPRAGAARIGGRALAGNRTRGQAGAGPSRGS